MTYPFLMNQVWKNHTASLWGKPLSTKTAATSHVMQGFTEAKSSRRQEGLLLSKASVASWAEQRVWWIRMVPPTVCWNIGCVLWCCAAHCTHCVIQGVCVWLAALFVTQASVVLFFFLMFNYLLFTTPDRSSINLLPAGDQFLSDLLIHTKQLVTSEGISSHLCGTNIN